MPVAIIAQGKRAPPQQQASTQIAGKWNTEFLSNISGSSHQLTL